MKIVNTLRWAHLAQVHRILFPIWVVFWICIQIFYVFPITVYRVLSAIGQKVQIWRVVGCWVDDSTLQEMQAAHQNYSAGPFVSIN